MKFFAFITVFAVSSIASAEVNLAKPAASSDTLGLTLLHKVKKGETVYKIAKMYKMTVPQIQALNPQMTMIKPGMTIHVVRHMPVGAKQSNDVTVPTQNTANHIVEKGETLYSIAKKYHTSVDIIRKWNNLGDAGLSLGQTIKVPVVNPLGDTNDDNSSKAKVEPIKVIEDAPAKPVEEKSKTESKTEEKPKTETKPEDGKGSAVVTPAKPTMIRVDDKGRDGGMPEKLVKPSAETGLKENEKKGVLVLASDQFVEPGSEDRAWVLFNDAQENEVVAVVNTKNNNLVWCVVKGKNKNGFAAVGVSKFVADKLGIFDEKTIVRVKYATTK
jgi:LysM repeat protein